MLRTFALLLTLAVSAAVAGCGGSSGSSSSGTGSAPAPAATSAAAPSSAAGGGVKIVMKNIQFAPQKATVKVGQTVTWTNEDSVVHDVTAKSGATFKSALFAKGKSFTFKATKPGTIDYVCTIHPGMEGTLTVVK